MARIALQVISFLPVLGSVPSPSQCGWRKDGGLTCLLAAGLFHTQREEGERKIKEEMRCILTEPKRDSDRGKGVGGQRECEGGGREQDQGGGEEVYTDASGDVGRHGLAHQEVTFHQVYAVVHRRPHQDGQRHRLHRTHVPGGHVENGHHQADQG